MRYEMTRRDLVRAGVMGAMTLGIGRTLGSMSNTAFGATAPTSGECAGWKPGDPIGYINWDIPEFEVPPYQGQRYEAAVPDTLDIAERAHLAVNGLTEMTNPLADYEAYDWVHILTNPPSMELNQWYFPYEEDWIGGLIRNRVMSGSEQNLHVEWQWMQVTLKLQGPDGLLYVPLKGRPWGLNGIEPTDIPTWNIFKERERPDHILEPYLCGCMLRTMSVYSRRDHDGPWRKAMRRLIDGLTNLAVVDGEYAYFWPSSMFSTKNRPSRSPMSRRPFEVEATNIPLGLVNAYGVLGYEPALKLAKQVINYLRKDFYGTNGAFYSEPGLELEAHTGAHLRGLLAMEEYAEATGDEEVMEFVISAFRHIQFLDTNFKRGVDDYDIVEAPGSSLVGYVPTWMPSPNWETSETDQVGLMLALAMRLSEAGVADHWDDADRGIRNQLAENQVTETSWIKEVSSKGPRARKMPYYTTDRVADRIKGGFAANPSPTDWAGLGLASGMGGCCTADGTNALFWAWEHILCYQAGKLKVNLLLNRASIWADVDSYIPYQGRVEVKIKKPLDLLVRIPEWVKPEQTRCQVSGQERRLGWNGRYAKVGDVKPGDVTQLTFPIFERTDKVWIQKREYTVVRKGNDVVSIDPPGVYCPLYQRQYYRQNTPRMRKVTRFISDETL